MAASRLFGIRLLVALVVVVVLLGLLAVATPGPLVAVRPVDASTGEVILTDARAVNAAGNNQKFATGSFDAAKFVASIWPSKVTPWVTEHAVGLSNLLSGLAENRAHAEQQYGVPSGSGGYSFLVHGKARVVSVDTTTPVGKIKLESRNWRGQDVAIYVGPLVFGTALRDAFPFLGFNHFTNQVQYASVSKSMNAYAVDQAYAGVDVNDLQGAVIEFSGAFAASSDGPINIVPLSIRVVP